MYFLGHYNLTKKYFKQELNNVEKIVNKNYKIKKYIDVSNSKEKLLKTEQQSIIHLVNHGIFSSDKPNNSGMFLKENGEDSFIDINELFKYKLEVEFIFMSGCSTGEVQPIKGEEPLGIISYLHSNGTKSAILSSWKIPSEIETPLKVVKDFYKYWIVNKLSKNIALQKAMLNNKTTNPYEYAGFILFGAFE